MLTVAVSEPPDWNNGQRVLVEKEQEQKSKDLSVHSGSCIAITGNEPPLSECMRCSFS